MKKSAVLVIMGVVLASCQSGRAAGKKSSAPAAIVLHYTLRGGFEGFEDTLTIRSDFSYIHSDPVGTLLKGKLPPKPTKHLTELLKRYGKVTWRHNDPPDPDVMDAISESLRLNGSGKKTKLEGQDLRDLLSLLRGLIDQGHKPDQPKEPGARPAD